MLRNYLEWLNSYQFHGIRPGLDRITKILKWLGDPHKKIKTVHIAGTNGKGSTGAILNELLKSHGLKTGLYTSPHLFKLNERFKINSIEISDEKLKDLLKILKITIKNFPTTYFEITTALAFLYFWEEKVDIAIIECGLGGRLDATNVIKPETSIITSISLDHTKYLGNTLEKIAYEKAGIIKRFTPCVLGNLEERLIPIFKEKCLRLNSPLFIWNKDFKIEQKENKWNYYGKKNFKDLDLNLKGFYQGINLGCALKTFEILEEKGFLKIDENKLKMALKEVKWPGRYERFLIKNKEILIDVAHNLEGVKTLKENLKKDDFKNFNLIFGATNEDEEKPFLEMLKELLILADNIFVCEFFSPRKIVTVEDWKKELGRINLNNVPIKFFKNPQEAIDKALEDKNNKILITGSIYFIANCLKILENHLNES
ncbi:bifunctional folylpolyglutamate synthase/dihydrofolate synthase [Thermodesulfobacterium hydrogeniphilum]|uniref:bifunctional folylpolyglutamate synthase/dihydrofolate synthase n=1 Tax=Thermodesulfobacterium hydrogeniphilum TaxID=161156 RepID=UPI00056DC61A|nr:folylpolyglutamate synthase/dihydrofolate synthase family protein [Thermodesulfobacterium hydrogeniphilum]